MRPWMAGAVFGDELSRLIEHFGGHHAAPNFRVHRFRKRPPLLIELRRELGFSSDTPLVGIVARLVPVKAHEVFLQAAARVRKSLPTAQFLFSPGYCGSIFTGFVATKDYQNGTTDLGTAMAISNCIINLPTDSVGQTVTFTPAVDYNTCKN